ncbi:MAG: hypothetical protein HY064_15700 [Bacteroidetes bacterium]|nr:hypothetical protein [Bacteroidota bacterium]
MKKIIFPIFICSLFSCSSPKTNSGKLNGTWIPVVEEMNGSQLPDSSFAKQKLVINDSNYTFTAESVDKGIVMYSDDQHMDIYGKDGVNAGKHITARWGVDGGMLNINYNLKGDEYPSTFDTKGNSSYFSCSFRHQ